MTKEGFRAYSGLQKSILAIFFFASAVERKSKVFEMKRRADLIFILLNNLFLTFSVTIRFSIVFSRFTKLQSENSFS